MGQVYRRPVFETLLTRTREPRRFIQVLAGPRQTGKTTLAAQLADAAGLPAHYATADEPALRNRAWLEAQWDIGRLRARGGEGAGALMILDEVQKIPGWAEVVKRLWDEDTRSRLQLQVMLLGSAPLLVQRGLSESLAGRFELIRVPHWSFLEMREAFQWNLDQFIFYGGYPGAASLIEDEHRWARYILDSLVETTISRDILLLTRVDKPALLRQLFKLGSDYSGQILSYQKMLGQLQDAGNTTTLAHYLELLAGSGMVTGLQKFSGARIRQRGSSPKLLVLNTGLMTAPSTRSFKQAREEPDFWGRLVETAIGAHLVNTSAGTNIEVFYWRDRNREVDFVLREGRKLTAVEVTSGHRKGALSGMEAFGEEFRPRRKLIVGGQGISIEEFLSMPAEAHVA